MVLKKQEFSDSSDENVAFNFDVTDAPNEVQVNTNKKTEAPLDLSVDNYMDDMFDQPEPKPTLNITPDSNYLKSFEAPTIEKKEFKQDFRPFYASSDEEDNDTVLPLDSKNSIMRDKRPTHIFHRNRPAVPIGFEKEAIQNNNEVANLADAEEDSINVFDNIIETEEIKQRTRT